MILSDGCGHPESRNEERRVIEVLDNAAFVFEGRNYNSIRFTDTRSRSCFMPRTLICRTRSFVMPKC